MAHEHDLAAERGMALHSMTEAFDDPAPAPPEPDPMDEAAFRVLNPSDGPGEFARVVYLDTAKRIRDDAVAEVLTEAERALEAMRAGHAAQIEHAFAQGSAHAVAGANETAAALIAGIDQALEEASTASMLAAAAILDGEFEPKPVDHIGEIEGTD